MAGARPENQSALARLMAASPTISVLVVIDDQGTTVQGHPSIAVAEAAKVLGDTAAALARRATAADN